MMELAKKQTAEMDPWIWEGEDLQYSTGIIQSDVDFKVVRIHFTIPPHWRKQHEIFIFYSSNNNNSCGDIDICRISCITERWTPQTLTSATAYGHGVILFNGTYWVFPPKTFLVLWNFRILYQLWFRWRSIPGICYIFMHAHLSSLLNPWI